MNAKFYAIYANDAPWCEIITGWKPSEQWEKASEVKTCDQAETWVRKSLVIFNHNSPTFD